MTFLASSPLLPQSLPSNTPSAKKALAAPSLLAILIFLSLLHQLPLATGAPEEAAPASGQLLAQNESCQYRVPKEVPVVREVFITADGLVLNDFLSLRNLTHHQEGRDCWFTLLVENRAPVPVEVTLHYQALLNGSEEREGSLDRVTLPANRTTRLTAYYHGVDSCALVPGSVEFELHDTKEAYH